MDLEKYYPELIETIYDSHPTSSEEVMTFMERGYKINEIPKQIRTISRKKVWIIDDVITAGTAIREVVTILKNAGAQIAGVLVALDRQEKGQGELSAIQEVQKELEIPVHALITMKDLMNYLDAKGESEACAK